MPKAFWSADSPKVFIVLTQEHSKALVEEIALSSLPNRGVKVKYWRLKHRSIVSLSDHYLLSPHSNAAFLQRQGLLTPKK